MAAGHPILTQEGTSPTCRISAALSESSSSFLAPTDRVPSLEKFPPTNTLAPPATLQVTSLSNHPPIPPKRKNRKWSPGMLELNPNIVLLASPPDSPGYLSQGEPSPSQPFDSQYPWMLVIPDDSAESQATVILSRSPSPSAPSDGDRQGPQK